MRFAGTCSIYSAEAISQLIRAAIYHALLLRFFKWAYQAKVINTFDRRSRAVVLRITVIAHTKSGQKSGNNFMEKYSPFSKTVFAVIIPPSM